jgi:phage tail tape-measure protein
MAYSAFTLARCEAELGITVQTGVNLFGHIPPAPFDPVTAARLVQFRGLATTINTEKARSEMLIAPVLADAWRVGAGRVSLLSGATFDVDLGAQLNGVCDFIFGHPPQLDTVTRPVLMITEAKNESVMGGLGQCAASMVAAQRFNHNRQPAVPTIHGCVTNGESWKFLRLNGTVLEIDIAEYLISEPDRILGLILNFLGIAAA